MKRIDRIKCILRGDTSELLDYLRSEMERLSAELRFEEAQELKMQYVTVERYQAKSVIVSPTIEDGDVFGIDQKEGDAGSTRSRRRFSPTP